MIIFELNQARRISINHIKHNSYSLNRCLTDYYDLECRDLKKLIAGVVG